MLEKPKEIVWIAWHEQENPKIVSTIPTMSKVLLFIYL